MGNFWRPLLEMISRQNARAMEYVVTAESPDELSRYFARVRQQRALI